MKLSYFADTDSLYIDLSEEPSVESREISEGVALDFNAAGRLVGIDIDEALDMADVLGTSPRLWMNLQSSGSSIIALAPQSTFHLKLSTEI